MGLLISNADRAAIQNRLRAGYPGRPAARLNAAKADVAALLKENAALEDAFLAVTKAIAKLSPGGKPRT